MRVQAFRPELAVEQFDEGIVGWLPWPGEVERHTTLVGPQVQIARHKLRALVHPNDRREPHLSPDSFQHLHNIGAAEVEPRLDRRREAGERIDDRQHPQLRSSRQLIVHEVHRPGFIGSCRRAAVLPQLGLHPALGRLVAQLQAHIAIQPIHALGIDPPAVRRSST